MKTSAKPVKCHTGSTCRLHGSHNALNTVAQQIATVKKQQKETLTQKQNLFPQGNLRRKENLTQDEFKELYDISRQIEDHAENNNYYLYDSIRKYVGTSYIYYNPYLREGVEGLRKALMKEQRGREVKENTLNSYVDMCEEAKNEMDECFQTYEQTFKEPKLLYRAINITDDKNPDETPLAYVKRTYQPGAIIEDSAYVSTTNDPDYMTFFKRRPRSGKPKKHNIVFEIVATKGLPVFEKSYSKENPHHIQKSSIQSYEREVLLNRNTKFRVVGVKNVTFEHSYNKGYGLGFFSDVPDKATFPVVQLEQIVD